MTKCRVFIEFSVCIHYRTSIYLPLRQKSEVVKLIVDAILAVHVDMKEEVVKSQDIFMKGIPRKRGGRGKRNCLM